MSDVSIYCTAVLAFLRNTQDEAIIGRDLRMDEALRYVASAADEFTSTDPACTWGIIAARARPVVLRGLVASWPALEMWSTADGMLASCYPGGVPAPRSSASSAAADAREDIVGAMASTDGRFRGYGERDPVRLPLCAAIRRIFARPPAPAAASVSSSPSAPGAAIATEVSEAGRDQLYLAQHVLWERPRDCADAPALPPPLGVATSATTPASAHVSAPPLLARGAAATDPAAGGAEGWLMPRPPHRAGAALLADTAWPAGLQAFLCTSASDDVAVSACPTRLDTVNLWMASGGSAPPSRTNLHYDEFDNLLCVVSGYKHVLLIPPPATSLLRPGPVSDPAAACHARGPSLARLEAGAAAGAAAAAAAVGGTMGDAAVVAAEECVLGPGDALFLPEGWWHEVTSAASLDAIAAAVPGCPGSVLAAARGDRRASAAGSGNEGPGNEVLRNQGSGSSAGPIANAVVAINMWWRGGMVASVDVASAGGRAEQALRLAARRVLEEEEEQEEEHEEVEAGERGEESKGGLDARASQDAAALCALVASIGGQRCGPAVSALASRLADLGGRRLARAIRAMGVRDGALQVLLTPLLDESLANCAAHGAAVNADLRRRAYSALADALDELSAQAAGDADIAEAPTAAPDAAMAMEAFWLAAGAARLSAVLRAPCQLHERRRVATVDEDVQAKRKKARVGEASSATSTSTEAHVQLSFEDAQATDVAFGVGTADDAGAVAPGACAGEGPGGLESAVDAVRALLSTAQARTRKLRGRAKLLRILGLDSDDECTHTKE